MICSIQDEGDRQMILLALAELSLRRPGWEPAAIRPVAQKLGGEQMFDEFRKYSLHPDGNVLMDFSLTYFLGYGPKPVSITCRRCAKTSYNLGDVAHKYCAHCNVFHEQIPADYRRTWINGHPRPLSHITGLE